MRSRLGRQVSVPFLWEEDGVGHGMNMTCRTMCLKWDNERELTALTAMQAAENFLLIQRGWPWKRK
jgi:hypothetical protein